MAWIAARTGDRTAAAMDGDRTPITVASRGVVRDRNEPMSWEPGPRYDLSADVLVAQTPVMASSWRSSPEPFTPVTAVSAGSKMAAVGCRLRGRDSHQRQLERVWSATGTGRCLRGLDLVTIFLQTLLSFA